MKVTAFLITTTSKYFKMVNKIITMNEIHSPYSLEIRYALQYLFSIVLKKTIALVTYLKTRAFHFLHLQFSIHSLQCVNSASLVSKSSTISLTLNVLILYLVMWNQRRQAELEMIFFRTFRKSNFVVKIRIFFVTSINKTVE